MDYNSNVNYTESDPEGDFIFRPQINTRMLWPVSDQNSINLALGGGYSAYVKNPELDRAFITPGSELSFDLYAGDFWINLHDRFSITENTLPGSDRGGHGRLLAVPERPGRGDGLGLEQGDRAKVGYDHVNYDSLTAATARTPAVSRAGTPRSFPRRRVTP